MRSLTKMIIGVALLIALVWTLKRSLNIPSLRDLFTSKPVVIDQTPILIKEIKSIAQLVTVTAYDEVVVDSTVVTTMSSVVNSINALSPIPFIPYKSTRLVLIGKGKILAGTNLQQLDKKDFTINNDTITLVIPKAVILDAIINPSDFEVFDEKGNWNFKAVTMVKMKAKQKMIDRALQKNILAKADAKARMVMENFLKSTGYKVVNVETF